jgi:phasin
MVAKKIDDVFAIPSFDPAKITDSMREFAEKGAVQSKEAFAKMKTAAEDASKTVEVTMETAKAGSVELGMKAIDTLRTNTETAFAHLEALMGVKTMAELFELQTSFVRKSYETAVEQAKSMQEASKKIAEDLAKPGKEAAEKAMSAFKAA